MNELLKNPVIQVNGTATIGPNVESANLCEIKESRVVTTSLRVAEIFGKQHKHVLEAIRNIECSDGFRGSNFRLIQRISDLGQGRTRKDPCYLITRDGFTFLVMGFTGKTAAKFKEAYIRAFNEMEAKLRRRQEAEQLQPPSKPHYTTADMPRMVHEQLRQPDADVIVENYGWQRVVSSVTLARLTGRKHENICASVRRMFKHTLRPNRLFIRQTRTVHRGNGAGYDRNDGVMYYITIEGFRVLCTHSEGISGEVAKLVMAGFHKAKGKVRPGQPKEQPKPGAAMPPAPNLPQTPADMMRRFATAMAVMMGVDVKQVSDLMNDGGNK
jgi:Rha family phage regulatory protein